MPRVAREVLALAVMTGVLAACTAVVVDGRDLAWTTWRATSVAGRPPIAGSEPTIMFDGDRVRVFGGCGTRVSDAPATVSGDRLVIPPMLDSLAMCLSDGGLESPVMPIERDFMSILLSNDHVSVAGGQLRIESPGGAIELVRS